MSSNLGQLYGMQLDLWVSYEHSAHHKLQLQNSKSMRLKLGLILIVAVFVSFLVYYYYLLISPPKPQSYVAYYPYEIPDHPNPQENSSQFIEDLNLIKLMGFQGIKLTNFWNLYNHELLPSVFNEINKKGLKVILQLYFYETDEFPQNKTRIEEFISFLRASIMQIRDYPCLDRYALHYPFDYDQKNNTSYLQTISSIEYKTALQSIINEIASMDVKHPIYLISESIEYWGAITPKDLNHTKGFGVQPYFFVNENDIDLNNIESVMNVYRTTKKDVYIDEIGVQTGNLTIGKATDETNKARMIKEFLQYVNVKGYTWAYFGLFDLERPDHIEEWGLAYSNNTLKPSGLDLQKALRG